MENIDLLQSAFHDAGYQNEFEANKLMLLMWLDSYEEPIKPIVLGETRGILEILKVHAEFHVDLFKIGIEMKCVEKILHNLRDSAAFSQVS